MATRFATPIETIPGDSTTVDVYTCPAETEAVVQSLRVRNDQGVNTDVVLKFNSGAEVITLESQTVFAEDTAVLVYDKLLLKAGDRLRMESDTAEVKSLAFVLERDV